MLAHSATRFVRQSTEMARNLDRLSRPRRCRICSPQHGRHWFEGMPLLAQLRIAKSRSRTDGEGCGVSGSRGGGARPPSKEPGGRSQSLREQASSLCRSLTSESRAVQNRCAPGWPLGNRQKSPLSNSTSHGSRTSTCTASPSDQRSSSRFRRRRSAPGLHGVQDVRGRVHSALDPRARVPRPRPSRARRAPLPRRPPARHTRSPSTRHRTPLTQPPSSGRRQGLGSCREVGRRVRRS